MTDACRVWRCGAKVRDGQPICRACLRLIRDDEWKALRLAERAPMFPARISIDDDDLSTVSFLAFWGGGIDGSEQVMVRWEEEGLPCFRRVKGTGPITDLMRWLEYHLTLEAVINTLGRRRLVRKARRGQPRSSEGHEDEDRAAAC